MITLYHGDCLEVLPTLEAQSVDAVICDPPYGTTACKWDSVIPFEPMWREIKRVLRPRGACVLFGSQPFTSALVMSNPGWFKYEWVWEKPNANNFIACNHEPPKVHESIAVFGDAYPDYYPQFSIGSPYVVTGNPRLVRGKDSGTPPKPATTINAGTRHPRSIVKFGLDKKLHPTQKPLALLEYLVKTYTDEGDTVLDFAMGSGTTGHACMNLGRRFIGIERDATYYAIAERRIKDAADPLRHMEAAS